MDKIYSRKRIQMPKIYINRFPKDKKDKKRQIMLKISIILIIAVCVMLRIIRGINPIINNLCIDASKRESTLVSNRIATEVMSHYSYDDMVTIYRDNNNNVTMLKSNIITINEINSDVAMKIQEEFEKNDQIKTHLRFRKFYRYKDIIRFRTRHSYKSFNIRYCYNKSEK